ncbi:MAG: MGMT family protein [Beutenbergiaceae bacterium]
MLPPPDDYAELVLDVVAAIPAGKVASYGAIAEAVRTVTGRGSARMVGRVLARYGDQVCWWRVVRSAGVLAEPVAQRQRALLRADGVPMVGDPPRVDMTAAALAPVLGG